VFISSIKSELSGEILIPASKSHTIRAVAIAGIANGTSILSNPLYSSDAVSCINGIKEFGAKILQNENLIIEGVGGLPKPSCKKIDVGNSGTSLRILTALASLADFPIAFDGDDSIRNRLMIPLLTALEKLGARYETKNGRCPFIIQGPVKGGKTTIQGISSQFLTALLIACPLAEHDTEIVVTELNERPYVEITIDWLLKLGIKFGQEGLDKFYIKGNQVYPSFNLQIPADFSSATFAACAAAITGSEVLIKGLDFTDKQGDKCVFDYLRQMGISIKHTSNGVIVKGGDLQGIDIDMNATPDALPAMAVTGCFARGVTRLLNVPQARLKECDRIMASARELTKMGARIEEYPDGLVIHQSKLTGTSVHGYNDHRMVMAMAIAGMGAGGKVVVDTAESVGITYPTFVNDMNNLGAKLEMK
jgi:3-phosphoshikimate 1-carboxyvinyltransferase